MLTDRKLGNKIVIYNKKVYRAYPAAPRKSKRCLISSTSYNQKFDLCIRRLKCSEKGKSLLFGLKVRRVCVSN